MNPNPLPLTRTTRPNRQIVPGKLWDWLRGDDPAKAKGVTAAVWKMEKLDLAELERAAAG